MRALKCCKDRKRKGRERKKHDCDEQLSVAPPQTSPVSHYEAAVL